MARGDKSKYTSKQKRMAEHIEEGYAKRGASGKKAKRIAWATVNKETGGAGHRIRTKSSSKKGGRIGGRAQSQAKRSAAAKKGWASRRHEGHSAH